MRAGRPEGLARGGDWQAGQGLYVPRVEGVEVFCEWGEMPHNDEESHFEEYGAYAIATSPCVLHVETEIEEVAADFFEEQKELVVRLVSEEDVMRGF